VLINKNLEHSDRDLMLHFVMVVVWWLLEENRKQMMDLLLDYYLYQLIDLLVMNVQMIEDDHWINNYLLDVGNEVSLLIHGLCLGWHLKDDEEQTFTARRFNDANRSLFQVVV
jgi:hypothetical protein